MSKYNLVELLNEIKGGRTGTYLATLDELEEVVKMLESYEEIRGVKQLGISGDGKTQFEYIILPSDGDAFSIYPFKFDPERETGKLPFSIAGDINQAKKYIKLMDADADVFTNMEYKAFTPQMRDIDENVEDILAKQEPNMEELKREIGNHLAAYEEGTIDGDDLAQAVGEIIFGKVKAPGMYIDDEEWEEEMGRGVKEEEVEEVTEEKVEIEEATMPSRSLFKGTKTQIDSYLESLKREQDRDKDKFEKEYGDFSNDDWKEDFDNYVADKGLEEHFSRFLKDYQ